MALSFQEIILRLLLAALMGSAVGLERERLNWVAGLRTHMLVCVGSALIMMVSAYGFAEVLKYKDVVLDPSRVAAQVVSGIGFLGAGTIFFWRKEVLRGLTTAAALWAVAGVGLAIGGGMYFAGTAATILILIILALMKPLERKLFKSSETQRHSLTIRMIPTKFSLRNLEDTMNAAGIEVIEMKINRISDTTPDHDYLLEINIMGKGEKLLHLADEIKVKEGIQSISYQ
ncbi:MAG: MgtC/SapB family protein [Chitinophagaceae bacterium]|nr:MgtC/SapB family protein [Chitinophagaceae bacterium]